MRVIKYKHHSAASSEWSIPTRSFGWINQLSKQTSLTQTILDKVLAEAIPTDLDRECHRNLKRKQGPSLWDDYCVSMGKELMKDDDIMTESEAIPPHHSEETMELPGSKSVVEDVLKEIRQVKIESVEKEVDMKEKDPALSDAAGLKEAMGKGGGEKGALLGSNCEGQTEFDVDADGSFRFYILDAYEEAFGVIYLFGKVKVGDTYKSCCVVVKSSLRCVYAIPNASIFPSHELITLEQEVKDSRLSPESFRDKLHEMASKLKNDVSQLLSPFKVSDVSMAIVKRNLAFESPDVPPAGEQYVLKIKYPFEDPPLREDLKGESFSALLGSNTSALEIFIRKTKITGPCWLKISDFSPYTPSQRVSWCKFEVTVESPKVITVVDSEEKMDRPPAVVTAINIKTIVNEKQNMSEIVSASAFCFHNVKIDVAMPVGERKRFGIQNHFTVVRNPEGTCYPIGWREEVADINSKKGRRVLFSESSESALLTQFFMELHRLDSDVFVGHNISGFDLDVLVQRSQACKVSIFCWSKIGRLKRTCMPQIKGGLMSCIAGRLLCDTDLCSRDLLESEVRYSLSHLARKEITPSDIPKMFQSSKTLVELIECGEYDAWYSMELMFHLSALPLNLQLTNISGNLWGKTLQENS